MSLRDQSGSGGTGLNAGAGALIIDGAGSVVLDPATEHLHRRRSYSNRVPSSSPHRVRPAPARSRSWIRHRPIRSWNSRRRTRRPMRSRVSVLATRSRSTTFWKPRYPIPTASSRCKAPTLAEPSPRASRSIFRGRRLRIFSPQSAQPTPGSITPPAIAAAR